MKTYGRVKTIIFAAMIPACLAGAMFLFNSSIVQPLLGFNRKLDREFKSIATGQTRSEIIARMGNPQESNTAFRLSQKSGYEQAYERAMRSKSKYFLFWSNPIDITYAIGFDADDRVTITEHGGS